MEIYSAWRKLNGTLPEDIEWDAEVGEWGRNAAMASAPLPSYRIKKGRLFIQNLHYPLYEHSKWDIYLLSPAPLPWAEI